MDNTQKQFISILSSGIRNKVANKLYDNVDWNEVLELANKHKVQGIIYLALRKSNLVSQINKKRLNLLKQEATKIAIKQASNISSLENIFKKINEKNISVIVLKGLVVRNFYPQPDQRSMVDVDILVHKEDIEKVKECLIDMGYKVIESHESSHYITLVHGAYPIIEIHWNLFKRDEFSDDLDHYERFIWKQAIKFNIGKEEVLCLGYEDLALHLCMNMADHLTGIGFVLSHLCDFVLLVEQKDDEINWDSFIMKARMYGFEKFSIIMFIVCKELFEMNIPNEIDISIINNKKNIEALINDIFQCGINDKKEISNQFDTQIAFNSNDEDSDVTLETIKRYFKFIFPSIEDMSDKYSYAKKLKILVPIAWIHHLFYGIFSKEYSFRDKFKFLTKGASISVNRNKLLEWMEL